MARKFLTPIDLAGLELQNAVVQNLPTGSLPGSPAEGRIAYDSTTHQLKVAISGVWTALSTSGAADATTGSKGIIQLAGDLGGAGTTAAAPLISAGAITTGKLASTVTLATIASTNASTGSITASSQKITNLADPTTSTDAATKNYVDNNGNIVNTWKPAVKAATTANGTLATAYANGQVIDGYTLVTGDRILLKNQTTGSENGIYIVQASGAPVRATDDGGTLGASVYVAVQSGTANTQSIWRTSVGGTSWSAGFNITPGQVALRWGPSNNTSISGDATAITFLANAATVTLNNTGFGFNGRTTPAYAIDLGSGTATALGIGFGSNEFAVYRSAANTLTIGGISGAQTLNIDSVTGTTASTLTLTARNSGSAVTNTFTASSAGDLSIQPGGTNGSITLSPQGTGTIVASSKRITSVADPTSAQDAATKNYVDVAVQGLDPKASVLVATVGTETFTVSAGAVTQIAGTSVDGVSPAIGDRILVKDAPASTGAGSPNSSQPGNGIYTVTNATTNLTLARATDFDAWTEIPGAYTWVERGTANSDTAFISTADQGGTLNTTAIKFVKFANATASQSSYYSALGSGTSTTFSITQATHQLRSSRGIVAQIQEESTGNVVDGDISIASNGDATFTFGTSQTLSGFRFTLIG